MMREIYHLYCPLKGPCSVPFMVFRRNPCLVDWEKKSSTGILYNSVWHLWNSVSPFVWRWILYIFYTSCWELWLVNLKHAPSYKTTWKSQYYTLAWLFIFPPESPRAVNRILQRLFAQLLGWETYVRFLLFYIPKSSLHISWVGSHLWHATL